MRRVVEGRLRSLRASACIALLASFGGALALGVVAPSAANPVLSFARPSKYPTGKAPASVALGDLNGDRKLDLVTVNGPALSTLLNRGDGGFTSRRDYATTHADFVALSDLNGDGRLDVATVNADSVSVFLNTGSRTFAPRRDYAIGATVVGDNIAVGDVNGDGLPDLAALNEVASTIAVFPNAGDGTFPTRRDYQTADDPQFVAIGDLNGDGKADLVTVNGEVASVLLNRGDGSFGGRHDYPTGSWSDSVAIADLNADGAPDLATDNNGDTGGDTSGTVSVLLTRGDGTFRRRRDYVATDALGIAIGDLNGDRKPELVTRGETYNNSGDTIVYVLVNRGDGSFEPKLGYPAGQNPSSLALGDLNGDGRLDVATGNFDGDDVSVLLNTPGLCTVQDAWRMTVPAARRTITRGNCRVGTIRRVYSHGVKRGRVISQKPDRFTVLKKGATVRLVVSRGRKR
ncbi:MAG: FG-GAP-like repeat-containing protein [Pyrinomonadaceae bacterium]